MKCIVGLGNFGSTYTNTRHNIGFYLIDTFASQHCSEWRHDKKHASLTTILSKSNTRVVLIKPQTYMNRSGQAVLSIASYYSIDPADILVIHDDIDLHIARLQCKYGGGHAGHNGLRDIISSLGTKNFARIRVGVGRPTGSMAAMSVADYVLGKFHDDEIDAIMNKRPIIETWISKRIDGTIDIHP